MNMTSTYINLEGWLDESMQFEPVRLEESPFLLAEARPRYAGSVVAELRDQAGSELLARSCELGFPKGCAPRPLQATVGWLRVSMPRHPAARELALLHDGRMIFSTRVDEDPPVVSVELAAEAGDDAIGFRYAISDASAALAFALLDESGHAYAAAVRRKDNTYSIVLTPFAGYGRCRLRVQATRNARTAEALSEPFETPEGHVTGRIISPASDALLMPDHALSLIGNLSIAESGRAVEWNAQLVHWVVDGVASDQTEQCAAVDKLEPGSHVIELRYGENPDTSTVLHKVIVRVRERSPGEEAYAEAVRRYDAARAANRHLHPKRCESNLRSHPTPRGHDCRCHGRSQGR